MPYQYITKALLFLAILLPATARSAEVSAPGTTVIAEDTLWEGSRVLGGLIVVEKGATLTLRPGTELLFESGSILSVAGTLVARGTGESAIRFAAAGESPAPGAWKGIQFTGGGEGSVLEHCEIDHAEMVIIDSSSPAIRDCALSTGVKGISVVREAAPLIEGNRVTAMSQGGIEIILGAKPLVSGNVVERCGPFGIAAGQDAMPTLRGNTVRECAAGISVTRSAAAVEGNLLEGNDTGVLVVGTGPEAVIRGNRVRDNGAGIVCEKFSSPVVEDNSVSGSADGIVCFMGSNPAIRNNEIAGNDKGVTCIQISAPVIAANNISGNAVGVYLHLSSYAIINGNNFFDNGMHIELDNMSSDWEIRVADKPTRGRQARNVTQVGKGVALPGDFSEETAWIGIVDATGNWWGEASTAEMEEKGPEADIAALRDHYDVPTLTYEGYEGEYVQDRIDYGKWAAARIPSAGPRTGQSSQEKGDSSR